MRQIGLAIDAVASYGRGIIGGIMEYCHSNPDWFISVEPLWSFGKLPDIAEWEVDGMIVQVFSEEFEKQVLAARIPAVNVSNYTTHQLLLPTIVPDDAAVAEMAADHLISLGFRNVGFCWSGTTRYGGLRLDAFRKRLESAGIQLSEFNAIAQDLSQWLGALPLPAAVFGANDDWAHRVLNAARKIGLKVPDQLAVIGVDDDELFNTLVTPSLSSIAIPLKQIGYAAAERLERLMNQTAVEPMTLFPPVRVVSRQSTDVLSAKDQDVISAVRFIRESAAKPIQVGDVLNHVPLSRRSLERRFRRSIGHSISDEIRVAHIEQAKKLLIETEFSMPQVASGSGFIGATRLGIVFHKAIGETPTQFRRRVRLGGAMPSTVR